MMFTVLWDNDGVLVDTEGRYFRATQAVLASVGIELTLDQFREISLKRGESVFGLAVAQGMALEKIACLRAKRNRLYAESLRQPCVIEGVEEALRALHGRVTMGVVTSSRRDHFDIAHAESGLMRYIDFVLTREDYEHTKPNPEPYLTAMKRHQLAPEQCLVIEDSQRGLAAARAAGLECLIVWSEWTGSGDFSGACKVLGSIAEVPREVLRRASQGHEGQPRRQP